MRTLALILAVALLHGVVTHAQVAAQTGGLTFHARPIQDTFLIYEPVWVEFEAENTTDTVQPAYPLALGDPFITFDVFDTTEGSVTPGRPVNDIFTSDRDSLTAHGRSSGVARLDYYANSRDSMSQREYFPPGQYRAVFRWYRPRLVFSAEPHEYLEDSFEFWVVIPTGDELAAMDEFRRAFRERCRALEEGLFNCYCSHPSSRYADDCLAVIATLGGSTECESPQIDYEKLRWRLIVDYSSHPAVIGEMSRLYSSSERYCPNRGGRRAMNKILDSIPADSRAARMARQLIQTGQEHWWREPAGPAW